MSRSRSRSPEPRYRQEMDRREERPEVEEQPAKRVRADTQKEDRARGKRLFGNILGTLQKFQKEDKTSRKSEAAKRREEISEKVQNKIRSEANLHHEIAESERELKSLRIQTDSAEYILKHKEAAMLARHSSLKPISYFLHTSLAVPAPLVFEGNLLNPSPIPLNKGPTREPPQADAVRPLYYLPKILLPNQQSTLDTRQTNISELITDESSLLAKEKESNQTTTKTNRARIEELSRRLTELRAQVKPEKRDRDDFGRRPREERGEDSEMPHEDRREEDVREDVGDREEGVQIRGEDGDIEVEY